MKERIVRAVAGSMVLLSGLLGFFVSINWIWLGVFVGANLLQSSFTGFCPLDMILKGFGMKGQPDRKGYAKRRHDVQGCCPVE
jgi:hypothetical protein